MDNNYLDARHPVFGRVAGGIDVVDAIARVTTDTNDHPRTDVTIIGAEIV